MNFILASASPRRRELLKSINLDFEIITTDIEDELKLDLVGSDLSLKLSEAKAIDVAKKVQGNDEYSGEYIVIGADTTVKLGDEIFGKPADRNEAQVMLGKLSGNCHEVITGVTIVKLPEFKVISDKEETKVYFKKLTSAEIDSYIETNEYIGKAGAYAIQGYGALMVARIEGCYPNIVGLPLYKLNNMLHTFKVNLFECINI